MFSPVTGLLSQRPDEGAGDVAEMTERTSGTNRDGQRGRYPPVGQQPGGCGSSRSIELTLRYVSRVPSRPCESETGPALD